jgi:hypothetical protein
MPSIQLGDSSPGFSHFQACQLTLQALWTLLQDLQTRFTIEACSDCFRDGQIVNSITDSGGRSCEQCEGYHEYILDRPS